jgi:transcriptional regulator with XRE-family HTH domain
MTVNEARNAAAEAVQELGSWPSVPDPGDLSRRLAARRAELRLSLVQVAGRARVTVRYLEYLEKFPAQPGPAVLRRLAAALRTTPTVLLGAGSDMPQGRRTRVPGMLEPLVPIECHHLLAPGGIGRISFSTASGLLILPANYAVIAGTIVLRTCSGSVIAAHGKDPVAFEADHFDEALGQGWSHGIGKLVFWDDSSLFSSIRCWCVMQNCRRWPARPSHIRITRWLCPRSASA